MASVGNASLLIVPKFDNLGKSVTNALKGVDTSSVGQAGGASYASAFSTGTTKGLAGAGAIMGVVSSITTKAINTVSSSVSSAISRMDTLNNYPRVMQSLGYSADSASASISTMSTRLQGLPTALDTMASTVQGIVAITGDLDKATNVGLALNDMLIAGGASTEAISSSMEQFRQILAKGKPEMQDWRTLTQAMPGQMAQLAEAMLGAGATANDLYEALGGGKNDPTITLDELMDTLVELDQNGGENITAFAEQAKTASGGVATSMANMQTAVTRGVADIFQSIGSDNINNLFSGIGKGFEGALQYVAGIISDTKQPILDAITPVIETVTSTVSSLAEKVKQPIEDIIKQLPQLVSALAPAAAGLLGLTAANKGISSLSTLLTNTWAPLVKLQSIAGKASDAFLGLATVCKENSTLQNGLLGVSEKLASKMGGGLVAGAGLAAAGIGLLAAAIIDAKNKSDTFKKGTEGLEQACKGAGDSVTSITTAFDNIAAKAQPTTKSLYEIQQAVQDQAEASAQLADDFNSRNQKVDEQVGTLEACKDMIEKLTGKSEDLSAVEQEQLKYAIDQVNDSCGTQYKVVDAAKGIISDEKDEILKNTDAIKANIDAREKQIKLENEKSKLTDLYAKQTTYKQTYQDALTTEQSAKDEYIAQSNVSGQSQDVIDYYLDRWETAKAATEAAKGELDGVNNSIDEIYDNMSKITSGVESISTTIASMSKDTSMAITNAFGSVDEFSQKMVDAGVSTDTLKNVGQDNLRDLANSCNGDIDTMIARIKLYNQTPLVDKENQIHIDDAQLIDAQGNIYTWNGTALVNKDGVAVVDDTKLTDSLGNVYTWNDSALKDQNGNAVIDNGIPAAQETLDKWNGTTTPPKEADISVAGKDLLSDANKEVDIWNNSGNLGTKSGSIFLNVLTNVGNAISSLFSGNAAGGIRLNAEGGIRYHANGAIATRAMPLDIVGEDGAEAIVPLTNRKYSQPFVDLITDGVAQKTGSQADVAAALAELKESISNMSVYLDGNKLVGHMAKGMNTRLGKLQRMGAIT